MSNLSGLNPQLGGMQQNPTARHPQPLSRDNISIPPTSSSSTDLSTPAGKKRKAPTAIASGSSGGTRQPNSNKKSKQDTDSVDEYEEGSERAGSVLTANGSGVGGTTGSGGKPKRHRVHFSCVECHRRKQKCDRQEPCGQCIARKVPALCKPFISEYENVNPGLDAAEVKSRLTRIEDMLSQIIPRLPTATSQGGGNDNGESSSRSMLGRGRGSGGFTGLGPTMQGLLSKDGEEVFHPNPDGRRDGEGDVVMDYRPGPPPPISTNPMSTPPALPLHLQSAHARPQITLDPPSKELNDILRTLSESGIEKGALIQLLMSVPDRGMSDTLVELYFREIDWTRYKLNKPGFFRRYERFYEELHREPTNPYLDAEMLKWLPLMFIVLAIATLSAPRDVWGGEDGQKAWSRRFYGSSRAALTAAKALQRDNLDVVFAGLLTARYMLLSRRAAEGAIPLTSAFQLGLYRDGSVLNLADKREIELRRRAFACVYHLDRTTALLVGRPTSISDAHTDTKEPCNLDDDEVESPDFTGGPGHPLTTPTEYTQVIFRHRLAQIMGRIADHTFAIRLPDYSTVLQLDQELLDWQRSLPPFFALSNPDTTLDKKYHYIFVQRHILSCEFLFARITLHRPYLLRKRDRDNQYLYSIEAAIESAKLDLMGRREFMFEKPVDLKVNSGGYRVLNSYIVLGVFIKMDPTSARADELRRLLDVVAGQAPDELGRVSEPIVKDEMAIVDFLTQKATSGASGGQPIRNSAPIPPYSHVLPGHRPTSRSDHRMDTSADGASSSRARTLSDTLRRPQPVSTNSDGSGSSRPPFASDSAWSFVAPGMSQISVQSPFGQNGAKKSLVPGPLRPPVPRQSFFQRSGQSSSGQQAASEPIQGRSNSQQLQSSVSQVSDGQYQVQGLQGSTNTTPPNQVQYNRSSSDAQYAPSAVSDSSYSRQEFSPSHPVPGLNLPLLEEPAPFTDAWLDANFNFGMGDFGAAANAGQTGFNPFALAQQDTQEAESEETAFLNLLLSHIANSSSNGL